MCTMHSRTTEEIVKWYTPTRARAQMVLGVAFFLGGFGLELLTSQSGTFWLFMALWFFSLGVMGSAIAELKETSGIRDVSPYFDMRTAVLVVVFVLALVLQYFFVNPNPFD